ncbi:MAG: DUF5916 domain-containing protein [Prolixibacteraceae bacterium]
MKHAYFTIVLIILWGFQLQAQNSADSTKQEIKKVYTTQRLTTEKPIIDGVLNDACWQNNNWQGDFIQWIPNEGALPSFPTYINILYDSKNIYVAIRAVDYEPEKIIRKASRRDEFAGDMVGINFDSYHDFRTGFEFNVSAAGQKVDLLLTNPTNADFNWDAVWTAKTGMEDSAWVVEYEIPLSQLRYSSETEQIWGMHVWRWLDRKQEESDWEPLSLTGPGMLYQFGTLKGISNLPKSRRIEIMPYLLGRVSSIEKEEANPYAKKGFLPFGSIGLDAKIGLSSNFTADVTINPDFGQVESDPSVMNLSAFETFYEEKRPFFLEGQNIFNFDFDGNNLFYSRRIGQSPNYSPSLVNGEFMRYPANTSILGAAKISGKTSNGLSVGILQSITNNEKALISDGNRERLELVEPLTNYTMARILKDFNEGNTVLGGIVTSTNRFIDGYSQFNYMNSNALTTGLDFMHQWHNKEFYVDAKLVMSTIQGDTSAISALQQSSARFYQRPDAEHLDFDPMQTQLSGQGGSIKIGKGSVGHWRYSTSLNWRSPGLDLNDMGYMQMADQVTNVNSLSYFINEPKGIIRSLNVGIGQDNTWDYALNYQRAHYNASFSTQFLNKWSVNSHVCYFPDAIDSRLLRGGPAMIVPTKTHGTLSVSSNQSKKAGFSVFAYYEKGGEESSETFTLSPCISYQPINALKLSLSADYTLNQNELQYVGKASFPSTDYFLGNIDQKTLNLTFRVDYNITPELSIQYYGSPYASTGDYSNFKLIKDPMADNLEARYYQLNDDQSSGYTVYQIYGFNNPNFTFTQFRSNLVFRWEYLPGSKIYLVWANERTLYQSQPTAAISDAFKGLNQVFPNNTILLKVNYWFSL